MKRHVHRYLSYVKRQSHVTQDVHAVIFAAVMTVLLAGGFAFARYVWSGYFTVSSPLPRQSVVTRSETLGDSIKRIIGTVTDKAVFEEPTKLFRGNGEEIINK